MVNRYVTLGVVLLLANALLPAGQAAVPLATGHVVINEVLYNPAGSEAGNESVELYNPTALPVDLSGWNLSDDDARCNPPNDAIALNGTLAPGALLVVTIPESPRCVTLSNAGDAVLLRNADGALVDAVCWGGDCDAHSAAPSAPAAVDDGLSVQRCHLVNGDGTPALDAFGGAEYRAGAPTLGQQNAGCAV